MLYKAAIRETLENQPNLWIFQQACDDLIVEQDQVRGVVTQMGMRIFADSVVLTTGTFLADLSTSVCKITRAVGQVILPRSHWRNDCVNCRCASAA